MRKLFLCIYFTVTATWLYAHNPQVSTISILQDQQKKWTMFITAPLYTYQMALQSNYSDINIDSLDSKQIQKLIIDLIKNTTSIRNKGDVKLENEKFQLGHESIIFFDLIGMENNINEITIKFNSFKKLYSHFTFLKIVPYKGKQINFILNADNDFTYTTVEKTALISKQTIIYLLSILILIILGSIIFVKKYSSKK